MMLIGRVVTSGEVTAMQGGKVDLEALWRVRVVLPYRAADPSRGSGDGFFVALKEVGNEELTRAIQAKAG